MNDGARGKDEGKGKAPVGASRARARPETPAQESRRATIDSPGNGEVAATLDRDPARARGDQAPRGKGGKRSKATGNKATAKSTLREQPESRAKPSAQAAPPVETPPAPVPPESTVPTESEPAPAVAADRSLRGAPADASHPQRKETEASPLEAAPSPQPEVALTPPPAAPLPPLAQAEDIEAIVNADHRDPCAVLGMHPLTSEGDLVVRAFLPDAREAAVVDAGDGSVIARLERMHDAGFFAGALLGRTAPFSYRLRITTDGGHLDLNDAYRFPPILNENDEKLLAQGAHLRSYRKLGAHPQQLDRVSGVSFAVWAPNAHRVAVVGDFNNWDGRRHGMRLRHECGVWEIFVPEARAGQYYKYEIKSAPGASPTTRSDPCAFQAERWPGSASIIADLDAYQWNDRTWMEARRQSHPLRAPLSILEVHLGSWRRKPEEGARCLTYVELAEELPRYARELGFTHVELMPIGEYNFEGSLGYHPIALYAPTGRFGAPDDFRLLVDRCHQEGIGVILNWAPIHFPDDQQAPVQFDGSALYEHPDPRQRRHPQWDTLMYDYGRAGVSNYLLSNALFWMDCYHIDGLRVHGLSSILYLDYGRSPDQWSRNRFGGHENLEAVDFLRRLNEVVYSEEAGIFTVAEETTGWPMVSRPTFLGGLGFGFKWNEVWFHETLRYMARVPIHKRYYHDELTHGPAYAYQENHVLALSHDLVVGGKGPILGRMPGNRWEKFANLRLYYGLMYTQPGKKLMFMGNEFAQDREWNHEISLDWHLLDDPFHKGVQNLVSDLNALYAAMPALHEGDCEEGGFSWIDSNDSDQCVISYLRTAMSGPGIAAIVCNFTPVVRHDYKIGVPAEGYYIERLNTDSGRYQGSNAGNAGGVWANPEPLHGRPHSLSLLLPPFSLVIFERADGPSSQ